LLDVRTSFLDSPDFRVPYVKKSVFILSKGLR
jgi:hypothetical protein